MLSNIHDLVKFLEISRENERCLLVENNQLQAENAKLRKLVRMYGEYASQDRCEGCACKSRCNDGEIDECWQLTEIRGLERELGIGAN